MFKFGVFFFAFLAINLVNQTYSAPPARNAKSPDLIVPKTEFNQESIPKEFPNRVLENIHGNSIVTNIKTEPVKAVFGDQGYIDPKNLESHDTKPSDKYVRNLEISGKTRNLIDFPVDKPSSRIQSASKSRESISHKGKTLESVVEKLKLRLEKKNQDLNKNAPKTNKKPDSTPLDLSISGKESQLSSKPLKKENQDPNENVPKTNEKPDSTPLDLSISGKESQSSSKPIETISFKRETSESIVEKFKQRQQNRDPNESEPPNKKVKVDNENVVTNERERSPEPESERSSGNEYLTFQGIRPYWRKFRAYDATLRELPIEVFSFNTIEGIKRVVYIPKRVEEDYLAAGIHEMPLVAMNGIRFDWKFSDNHVRMEQMSEE